MPRRSDHSVRNAQTRTNAARHVTSNSKLRAMTFVAITTTQPYSNGRLCTAFSASIVWSPIRLANSEADKSNSAPRLSGASGIFTPSTDVVVAGFGAGADASAGAAGGPA